MTTSTMTITLQPDLHSCIKAAYMNVLTGLSYTPIIGESRADLKQNHISMNNYRLEHLQDEMKRRYGMSQKKNTKIVLSQAFQKQCEEILGHTSSSQVVSHIVSYCVAQLENKPIHAFYFKQWIKKEIALQNVYTTVLLYQLYGS